MQVQTISMLLFGGLLLGLVWSIYHVFIKQCWDTFVACFAGRSLKTGRVTKSAASKPVADIQQSLLVVYLMAPSSGYAGYNLLQTCTCIGFQFDTKRGIFTYAQSDDGSPWIQLANARKPGFFQLESLGADYFPGIALFMELSELGKDAVSACEQFILIIEQLQQELGGVCHNAQRQIITQADYIKWRQQADSICRQYGTGDLFAQMEVGHV